MSDPIMLQEIFLCGTNDGDLYRQRITPIIANLNAKVARGIYNAKRALDLWQYAADDMVRRYSTEQMGRAKATLTIVSKADRVLLAQDLATYYSDEIAL